MHRGRSYIPVRHPKAHTSLALTYIAAKPKAIPLTTYVVADLNSEAGQALVKDALAAMVCSSYY